MRGPPAPIPPPPITEKGSGHVERMPNVDRMRGDGAVIAPDACLVGELVRLLGSIRYGEPAAEIAQHCREIAAAYQQRPSHNPLQEANYREIAQMMTAEADRFSRKANSHPDRAAIGGDGGLRAAS